MNVNKTLKLLEILRWIFVFFGFYFAFKNGLTAQSRFILLAPAVILPLTGLTALQLLCFNKTKSNVGYQHAPRYQIQSGLNLLAIAITTVLCWWFNWGIMAYVALMSVTLIFFGFSGINHALSIFQDKNYAPLNILRPIMALVLILMVLWLMLPALGY